ncbi:MAG: sulfotransferase domain-containing protein [Candidatus Sulfotelmatobacter sp.]|jgi:Sulfotransferase domain
MPLVQGILQQSVGAVWQASRVLTGRQPAGRGVTVFPDDIFLVSYPRSGNTWTRFLLGNLIYQKDPITFTNIESKIPEIYFNPDRFLRRLPRPRILKSHECFQPHYPRVIYVVRDPRDVAISYYHHNVKARNISDDYSISKFVRRFMAGEFDPKFGSWRDNVLSWTALRTGDPRFLMLRYEDMKVNPVTVLESVVTFLKRCSFREFDSSPNAIQRAIELSSPERMRALEKQESNRWILTRGTRSDKPFVRSAVAGNWKSQLDQESVATIESAWGGLMHNLGYELVSIRNADSVMALRNKSS